MHTAPHRTAPHRTAPHAYTPRTHHCRYVCMGPEVKSKQVHTHHTCVHSTLINTDVKCAFLVVETSEQKSWLEVLHINPGFGQIFGVGDFCIPTAKPAAIEYAALLNAANDDGNFALGYHEINQSDGTDTEVMIRLLLLP